MDIEQSFSVPFPPETVWKSFHDVEGLVTCLPGASLTEPPGDGPLKLAMTVKLGPIVAAFKGEGALSLDEVNRSGVISGSGADRKSGSRAKGDARFALTPEGESATRVDVTVDYSISGSLAQFSRGGLIREVATRLTEAFAENLKARLESESAASSERSTATAPSAVSSSDASPTSAPDTPPARVASEPEARPAPRPAAQPLDLGNLFWPMLLQRIRRFFGFGKKRDDR